MSNEPVVGAGTKWHRSGRRCGCGDCRFFSLEERPVCPMKDDPSAIDLWYYDPKWLGMKDYIDPLDFRPPVAYTEKSEEEKDVESSDSTPASTED